ncbi:hypothetical protein LLG95_00570 [bacterium]|nr:hypothetical protein [bacterium]
MRRYPLRVEYFNGIADCLLKSGVSAVYTAALPPGGSVEERASTLARFIAETVREEKLHLIAHSLGGLDSRHYVAHLGGAERVVSLTTLATPHRGSSLADLTSDLINPVLKLVGKLGRRTWMEELRRSTAAHHDLRPSSCAAFNARTPDVDGVVYHSWAGAPPREALHGLLEVPAAVLERLEGGLNDGFVSLASAKWSGWRGSVPADHISLVGWQFTSAAKRHFNPGEFYRTLLPDLAAAEKI